MADSGERPNVPDYELFKAEDPSFDQPPPRRSLGLWLLAAGVIIVVAIAAYVMFGDRSPAQPPPAAEPETAAIPPPQEPVQPLGGTPEPIVVPPLEESDPVVRNLVKALTSHPRVAAWLTTDGLIRNFVVTVSNVSGGVTPARQLGVLRPTSDFAVVDRDGVLYIDPASYDRYNGLAAAAASVAPADAARLYATLNPRIEEAYRELGRPDTTFDATLERAIVLLLSTPIVDEPIRVKPHGATGYEFDAPNLEALPAAQKQFLRMGPRNLRSVQSSVRAIALALGIPAERLPAPPTP
jgi:hypothetical protein